MKKLLRLVLAAVLLTSGMSAVSFADGGSPFPTCSPGKCNI